MTNEDLSRCTYKSLFVSLCGMSRKKAGRVVNSFTELSVRAETGFNTTVCNRA